MRDMGIGSWPARRARRVPGGLALVQGDRRLTYGKLAARVDRLAAGFRALGVQPGDRVAYLGPNDIATFETLFATAHLGAVFVPLNTRLAAPEIAYLLEDSGAKVLVHGPEHAAVVAQTAPHDRGVAHVLTGLDAVPVAASPVDEPVTLDDPCLILYTSGTTGLPKGAVLTHGNLTWNTVNQLAHFDLASTDVALCVAPLFHVTGLGQVTMPTFFKGGTVVVAPKFDAEWMLRSIGRLSITGCSAVPTMLQMMCDHPSWDGADLSSLRLVVYGGSPVAERVAKRWLARGLRVLQGYGMTEAAPGVFMALPDGSVDHPVSVSVGVPHFFTEVALAAGDGAGPIESGRAAELLVRGPNVFAGYRQRPEATEAGFVDEWFRTGDVVRVEPDGWAYVVDRMTDMIISGGENIYPAEVEAALGEVDGVVDCAVVAVPDEKWGEVGMAFIVTRDAEPLDEELVRKHLEHRLARYKIPKHLRQVDVLPRNATGKLLRRQLRDRARTELTTGEDAT